MLTYNSSTNTYSGVANTTLSIDNGTSGYFLYVRGDRTCVPSNSTITATTLKTLGTLKEGNSTTVTVPNTQYGLVGNPFPSEIDLTLVTRGTKIADIYYVWDPKLTGINGIGAFQTLTRNGATYDVTPGSGSYGSQNKLIESGQAFFIHSTGNTQNTFSIPEAAKTTGTSNVLYTPTTIGEQFKTNLYVAGTPNQLLDGTLVQYDNTYSAGIDIDDALKMTNFQANFGMSREGSLLVVERRPIIGATDTIFFNMTGLSQQQYQLEFIANNLNHPGLFGFLEDTYQPALSTPIDLNGTTNFTFSVTADPATSAANRFRLVFKPLSALPVTFSSIKAYSQNTNVLVEWKVENERNMQRYDVEQSSDGVIFIRVATVVAQNSTTSNYNWLDTHPYNGANFYRVKSFDLNGGIKYSPVVKVTLGDIKQLIAVYPDPVTGGKVNLELKNMAAGKYTIRLISNIGQVLFTTQINHLEGSSTETINISDIVKGLYQLEVIKPDNTIFNTKLTKL